MATGGGRASGVTRRIGTEKGDEDSSESDGETEPAKSFHRRLSTNKEIKYAAATESTCEAAPIDATRDQELRSSSQGAGEEAASCYRHPLSPRSQPPPRPTKAATKEGFLMKQTWSFNRWRRRYFQLKGHKLYYAKDPKGVEFEPAVEERGRCNDAVAMRGERTFHSTSGVLFPSQLHALLDTALQWDFEIFRLEQVSGQRPLLCLGMKLFQLFEVPQTLHVDVNTMHNWLSVIEMNYCATNWYHNSTHAADAMQTCAMFLEQDRLKRVLNPLDVACCLIAAAVHDVDHPGRTNAFLCNSGHALAIMYNDISVLESHHVACAFKLTLSDERVNIFKGLQQHVYKRVRFSIIDMVLATDMSKHFEHLGNFMNAFFREVREEQRKNQKPLLQLVVQPEGAVMTAEQLAFVKRIIIKCADVSNPTRPLSLCVEWALRISEEYFEQTDEEKGRNLPLALPTFDRASCSIPKSQIGFVDCVVKDMFQAWERFIHMPVLMENLERNYCFWEQKEQQGIRLLEDFASLMSSEPSGSEMLAETTLAATEASSGDARKMPPLCADEMAQCERGEVRQEHSSDLS